MEQYIKKSALVAEVERRLRLVIGMSQSGVGFTKNNPVLEFAISEYKEILSFINTLEVKEVDIEDSIKDTLAQKYVDYTFKRHNIDPESKEGQLIYYAYMHGMNQCLTQLRTQKGE